MMRNSDMRFFAVLCIVLLSGCSLLTPNLETLGNWRATADTAYKNQDYATAATYYHKLTQAVPSDSENWFRLGNSYARLQDTTAAVAAYRESLVRDKTYAKAWYNVGFNQLRDAQRTFSEAMDNVPPGSPMYPILKSYNEKLLQLIDEQNAAVGALNEHTRPTVVDPKAVEVIVLDNKKPVTQPAPVEPAHDAPSPTP